MLDSKSGELPDFKPKGGELFIRSLIFSSTKFKATGENVYPALFISETLPGEDRPETCPLFFTQDQIDKARDNTDLIKDAQLANLVFVAHAEDSPDFLGDMSEDLQEEVESAMSRLSALEILKLFFVKLFS